MIKLLSNTTELQIEFQRLSEKFESIEIITAWLGNPAKGIPFKYLEKFNMVDVYAGISFCHTHPEGIKCILELPKRKRKLVLIDEPFTFHMKVYHFYNANESALVMGSSNFTLSGFTDNAESNIVLEGKEKQGLITNYLLEIKSKISTYNRIEKIEGKWLEDYTRRFYERRKKLNDIKASDDSTREDVIQNAFVWLRNGTWGDYMEEFKKPFLQREENLLDFVNNHSNLLTLYNDALRFPWSPKIFEDENKRAMLLGNSSKIKKRDYGWLGHVGASGKFASLLSNRSLKKKTIICESINSISKLGFPINREELIKQLERLESTGPSIKVWGRSLAITQPELFYTISSDNVRRKLSKLLAKPISFFSRIEGYVYVLNIIHNSPWFNSPEPKNKIEKLIWQNRCAFLDVIFRGELQLKPYENKKLKTLTNFIILPDSPGNSISRQDIEKSEFRITKDSKHLFQQCSNKVTVEIKGVRLKATYKAREGRSDTLSVGKIAMSNLNIKAGNSVRITKKSIGNYKIEKI